jgi:TonB family protein
LQLTERQSGFFDEVLMDASDKYADHQLKDELARYCLPSSKRDASSRLAWVNSICILFLLIGIVGARSAAIQIRKPPPLEQVIPVLVEPLPPPPTTVQQVQPEEQHEEKSETPQVVVVTPNAPNIVFSVPTVGNVVVPSGVAVAPPAEPMKTPEPLRSVPKVIESTGQGGDRPQPEYPKMALSLGQQGKVIIAFTVDESGRIVSADIKESSGSSILDHSALDSIKRHWVFPPGAPNRQFEAPINYVLQHQ